MNIISDPDALAGWHLVEARIYKPGVYRVMLTRRTTFGRAEMINTHARQNVVTTAIEQGLLSRPNGYTMPR